MFVRTQHNIDRPSHHHCNNYNHTDTQYIIGITDWTTENNMRVTQAYRKMNKRTSTLAMLQLQLGEIKQKQKKREQGRTSQLIVLYVCIYLHVHHCKS